MEEQEPPKSVGRSIIKTLDETNNFMILNPSKNESLENITPLPKKSDLGLPINSFEEFGKTSKIEIIPFACLCGVNLGIYTRILSIAFLKEKLDEDSPLEINLNDFLKKYSLDFIKGCCRLKLLAPIITNVISLDLNAKLVEEKEILNNDTYDFPVYKF